jgi:S-adenosylmethionine hydrolase
MTPVRRIALVTDFGAGPYVGQMRLRLTELAPQVPVVDLISDLPPFRPDLAAYLLPALVRDLPVGTLYLCVVDPGVGSDREALALEADGNWYVGPDNGLLAIVARQASACRVLRVDWRPQRMSASFHGRDLFVPIAAMLASGSLPQAEALGREAMIGADWPDDMPRIVYADHYGNLMTGLRAAAIPQSATVHAGPRRLVFARTFCEVPPGTPFWYDNALGLLELAVNQGRADATLGLIPGDPITVQ